MNHELVTARFLAENDSEVDEQPTSDNPANSSNGLRVFVRASSIIGLIVGVLMIGCVAISLWQNRQSLKNQATTVRKKTSNPIDFVLWMGGSKHTLEDVFRETQRRSADEWKAMQPEHLKKFEIGDFKKTYPNFEPNFFNPPAKKPAR